MVRKIQKLLKAKNEPFAINCNSTEEAEELISDLDRLGYRPEGDAPARYKTGNINPVLLEACEEESTYYFYGTFPYFTYGRKSFYKKQGVEVLEFSEVKATAEPEAEDDFNAITYVEIFDNTAIENLCSALAQTPKKVVFVGSNRSRMNKACKTYSKILSHDDKIIEFAYRTCTNQLDKIVKTLSQIVEEEDKCCFDITGGSDIFLVALGIVCEKYRDRNVQIHRFDINNQTIIDCDKDGVMPFEKFPSLTVEENIGIYDGIMSETSVSGPDEVNTDDLDLLWGVLKDTPQTEWNSTTGALGKLVSEFLCITDKSGCIVRFTPNELTDGEKAIFATALMQRLKDKSLITVKPTKNGDVNLQFKNKFVKRCLTVQGLVLELKIYILASKATEKDGVTPFFSDVQTGVKMNWKPDAQIVAENPLNEIDVMMMDGVIPVFVSCKNGRVDVDELYKLNTVAENFGSKYAHKVLITNELMAAVSTPSYVCENFRQRAKLMNIKLIENVHSLTDEQITKLLTNYQLIQ